MNTEGIWSQWGVGITEALDFFNEVTENCTTMKRPILRWVLLLSLLLVLSQGVCGEDFPKPIGPVNDFAGIIPASEKQNMDILAREVLQKTGTSVVVATMPTIEDADGEYV